MYLPPAFREERLEVLHAAVRELAFASLVTHGAEGLDASHIPLHLLPQPAPLGSLIGHVARANPQWRLAQSPRPALAIFLGPHAYVSPDWYPNKHATGKDVPTWNYIAVHAHGTLELITDPGEVRAMLDQLTAQHEAGRPRPWKVGDAPPDYIDQQQHHIVGLRLTLARLEGKWKLSQNRAPADREGARAGLAASTGERERAVAAAMAETAGPGSGR
ncbi:MAG: FMN-binding negative transcriptional regulator [Xanthomonadaceae bacterium]|nr:FMN-binding negative transcriptional regulator [Xanthomonadaceae bacterium]MDE2245650.1 FMN-binding negative transcriptional regulator [Xanthomonadaceae bacterium]